MNLKKHLAIVLTASMVISSAFPSFAAELTVPGEEEISEDFTVEAASEEDILTEDGKLVENDETLITDGTVIDVNDIEEVEICDTDNDIEEQEDLLEIEDIDESLGSLYSDVPDTNNWRYNAIKFVTVKGIMNGTGNRRFSPDNNLTRAMFATIIYRMAGSPSVSFSSRFPDVPNGRYFSLPVVWANNKGIIKGHSNTGLFGTDENITREDLVVIMYRYAQSIGKDTSTKCSLSYFDDEFNVSDYAKEAMKWAVANGIISGRGNTGLIDPKGNATRVEAAAIIQRFISGSSNAVGKLERDKYFKSVISVSIPFASFNDPVVNAPKTFILEGLMDMLDLPYVACGTGDYLPYKYFSKNMASYEGITYSDLSKAASEIYGVTIPSSAYTTLVNKYANYLQDSNYFYRTSYNGRGGYTTYTLDSVSTLSNGTIYVEFTEYAYYTYDDRINCRRSVIFQGYAIFKQNPSGSKYPYKLIEIGDYC